MAALSLEFKEFFSSLTEDEQEKYWANFADDVDTKAACEEAGEEWDQEVESAALKYLKDLKIQKDLGESQTLESSDTLELPQDKWEESDETSSVTSSTKTSTSTVESVSTKLRSYSSSEIKIECAIGEGEFGKISKGILQGKNKLPVAVRVLRTLYGGSDTVGQLSAIMKLKHRNVVSVLGVWDTLNRQSDSACGPRILLHYFPEGNLLQYLFNPENPKDQATLVKLALDVIQGLEYLHSKNVVHGNLAARNVLIEKQRGKVLTHYNAKVTDHGIIQLVKARGTGKNYMNHNDSVLPLRWVPKELLEENSNGFTFSSDVWAFGVLFWEMLTKGSIPYGRKKEDSVSDLRRVFEIIMKGQSPMDIRVPLGYSDEITNVLKRIFQVDPLERPTFHDLRKEFISISASFKSLGKESKSKLEALRDDKKNPAMKKYASDNHASQRGRGESRARDTESSHRRGRGQKRAPAIIGATGGRTHEKVNFLYNKEVNNNAKAPPAPAPNKSPQLPEPGPGELNTSSSTWSVNPIPTLLSLFWQKISSRSPDDDKVPSLGSRSNGAASSYQGPPRNQREVVAPGNTPVSAFLALGARVEPSGGTSINTLPMRNSSPPPPPPPYTAEPLPNHSVFGARGEIRPAFARGLPRGSRKPNYTKEIKKKEQELENLKLQKLQYDIQKASKTWGKKMQQIESQIAELNAVSLPAARSGNTEFGCPPPPDFRHERERTRVSRAPSVRGGGGGRGQSYIHRGKERSSSSIYGK